MKPIRVIFFLILTAILTQVRGQDFPSPGLYDQRHQHLSVTQQVDSLVLATNIILRSNHTLGKEYLDYSLNKSRAINYDLGLCKVLYTYARYYVGIVFNNQAAIAHLEEGIKLAKKLKRPDILVKFYNVGGVLYSGLNQYEMALEYFSDGEILAKRIGDKRELLNYKINTARILINEGNYEKTNQIYYECLTLDPSIDVKFNILINMGANFSAYGQLDSAEHYYQGALKISGQTNSPDVCRIDAINNLAGLCLKTGEYHKSISLIQSITDLNVKLGNPWQLSLMWHNLGDAYHRIGIYDSAVFYLGKSAEIEKNEGYLEELGTSYNFLYKTYKAAGKPAQALTYLEKYKHLMDSLGAIEKSKDIEELLAKYEFERSKRKIVELKQKQSLNELQLKKQQADFNKKKYEDDLIAQKRENELAMLQNKNQLQEVLLQKGKAETEKRDAQILLLEKDQELQSSEVERQAMMRNTAIIGSVLLLLPALILIFVYRQKAANKELLAMKTEEVNRQKILEVIKDHELRAIRADLAGQEKEKSRIASELHDGIAGNLAGIKLMLSKITEDYGGDPKLYSVVQKVDRTYKEVRTITHHLSPPGMVNASFSKLIEKFLNEQQETAALKIDFICHPKNEIDQLADDIKIEIYRIIQELTYNIIKHAGTKLADIQLTLNEDYVNLIVEDKGRGFNLNQVQNGIGLSNIRSRVLKLDGNINIDSTIGRGTIIDIDIPLKEKSDSTIRDLA